MTANRQDQHLERDSTLSGSVGHNNPAVAGETAAAESGNNFPGTNPHPAHTALGTMSGRGSVFPGKD